MPTLNLLQQSLAGIALLTIILIFFQNLPTQPIHVDEHAWIQRGRFYFQAYFIDHHFSDSIWQDRNSFDQTKLTEYLFGAWTLFGESIGAIHTFDQTNFNQGWKDSLDERGWWTKDKWWYFQWRQFNTMGMQRVNESFPYRPDRLGVLIRETLLPGGAYTPKPPTLTLFLLFFFLVGLVVLLRQAKAQKNTHFLFWLCSTFLIMSSYVSLNIDRYFLPIIPYLVLTQSLGITLGIEWFIKVIKIRQHAQ